MQAYQILNFFLAIKFAMRWQENCTVTDPSACSFALNMQFDRVTVIKMCHEKRQRNKLLAEPIQFSSEKPKKKL